jgi:hypothetical protein
MLEPRSVFLPVRGKTVLILICSYSEKLVKLATLFYVYTTYCIVHLFPLQFCEQF